LKFIKMDNVCFCQYYINSPNRKACTSRICVCKFIPCDLIKIEWISYFIDNFYNFLIRIYVIFSYGLGFYLVLIELLIAVIYWYAHSMTLSCVLFGVFWVKRTLRGLTPKCGKLHSALWGQNQNNYHKVR
jgi:apolipoprotein N-acyltransferase